MCDLPNAKIPTVNLMNILENARDPKIIRAAKLYQHEERNPRKV